MAYVISGVPSSSNVPIPTVRTPTGLMPWWRPVAVGWPTTGSSASYVGPRGLGAVGTSKIESIQPYFPAYRRACLIRIPPVPSMSAAFGAQVDMSPYKFVKTTRTAPPPKGVLVNTAAGPIRLPPGAWYPQWTPAVGV